MCLRVCGLNRASDPPQNWPIASGAPPTESIHTFTRGCLQGLAMPRPRCRSLPRRVSSSFGCSAVKSKPTTATRLELDLDERRPLAADVHAALGQERRLLPLEDDRVEPRVEIAEEEVAVVLAERECP